MVPVTLRIFTAILSNNGRKLWTPLGAGTIDPTSLHAVKGHHSRLFFPQSQAVPAGMPKHDSLQESASIMALMDILRKDVRFRDLFKKGEVPSYIDLRDTTTLSICTFAKLPGVLGSLIEVKDHISLLVGIATNQTSRREVVASFVASGESIEFFHEFSL